MNFTTYENVTNLVEPIVIINDSTDKLLFGGISLMLFIILLVAFKEFGIKNAIIGASAISLFINILMYFLELVDVYFITAYVVLLAGGIIYRVFGGE